MPVTTFTAVVPSAVRPVLVAPAGAVRLADSVSPAGIAEGMLAVIDAPVWLVVTDQVLPVDVTEVGALPADGGVDHERRRAGDGDLVDRADLERHGLRGGLGRGGVGPRRAQRGRRC